MNFMEQKGLREFAEGDIIFKENDPGASMFIIQSGEVEVSAIKNKQKVVYAHLSKGAIFGEMALIDGYPRSATVTVIRNTKCIEMSRMLFQKNLEGLPKWMGSFFQIMAERLRDANKHAETLTSQDHSRQVVLMVSNVLAGLEPNLQDEISTPWKPLVQDIALLLNLPSAHVDGVMNKITLTPMAKSEMSSEHGRMLIVKDFSKFKFFADYCKSRFIEKQGNEVPIHFQKPNENELEFISFLFKVMREQRWEPEIEEHLFEEMFVEQFNKPLDDYKAELKKYRQAGLISSKLDNEDVKTFLVDKEKLQTLVGMHETLQEFEAMDVKL
ncbi:MAG: cyclic nucleotide-binding domain-containing protein [Candidatus Marinimicrobia bacterium]|nr:cyclic nucleotide-binding domain-containing protein [Candidatus Neomarinimicrobiota bacterium]